MMPMLKIFYIYFHDVDFVPIHVDEIVRALFQQGHRIHVFTHLENRSVVSHWRGMHVHLNNIPTVRMRYLSELLFMVFLMPWLCLQTIRERPDLVYCRHSAASVVAVFVAKLFRKKCFMEVNDILVDKLKFNRASRLKELWIHCYHALSLPFADRVLPVTTPIGNWVVSRYAVKSKSNAVIPNGVNTERFQPRLVDPSRRKYGLSENSKVILSLGSLFPWAGIDLLVQAAPTVLAVHPDCIFAVGSGEQPYLSEIQHQVEHARLSGSFKFFGFIPWEDASHFISTADVCVAPFVFKESRSGISSLRVLAYLACGRPVVGSDIFGLGDWLEQESIGFSFPVGCSEFLAQVLIRALNDRTQLREMGRRGRELVVRQCSWQKIVDRLVCLFSEDKPSGKAGGSI